MDLTPRKDKFIAQFLKVANLENISRFENFLREEISNDDIVAYSVKGKSITRKEYVDSNEEAVASFKKGNFKTQSQIRKKYESK